MQQTARAELYALTHRGNPGDIDYYRRFCKGGSSVLELGCGSGRVLSALVARGRRLVGLERDPRLIALARRALPESVQLVCGDMREFELEQRFSRIVIPYSGFFCLLTRADARRALRAIVRHLEPRGELAFDTYAGDAFHRNARPADVAADELEFVVSINDRGKRWNVFERSRWQRSRQRLDVTYVYEQANGRGRVEIELPQRYFLARELPPLLESAGLGLISLDGDFRGSHYDPRRSELMVVRARPL